MGSGARVSKQRRAPGAPQWRSKSRRRYINKPADGLLLGQLEGVANTLFKVFVQDAGVYGLRTIWQEGTAGAYIELFTVKADGNTVLLNDIANGGLPAYRVGVAPNKPIGSIFSLAAQVSGGQINITWTEPGTVLQESTNLTTWSDLTTATSPHRPTTGPRSSVFYRLKK
jgi:hypothetical protein